MTRGPVYALVAAFSLWGWLALSAQIPAPERQAFPHALHAGLFPQCSACHVGITSGEGPAYSVTADDCARCHDGDVLDAVNWSPPPPRASNLKFDHHLHVQDMEVECAVCHRTEASEGPMDVVRVQREACFECHGIEDHFAEDNTACGDCHLPLTGAVALPPARIAAFPRPADHDDPDFLSVHGGLADENAARCATCHARNTCNLCHLNGDRLPEVTALQTDARVAGILQGREGRWPRPASHDDPDWAMRHGASMESSGQPCADCHEQSGCRGCHTGEVLNEKVDAIPRAAAGDPRGIRLPDAWPPLHTPDFATRHEVAGAARSLECETCHSQNFCADCHNAPAAPGFHPLSYLQTHGSDATVRDMNCASCHTTEVFCRSCHQEIGLSSEDARAKTYHDAVPQWLLVHGRAARQGMETCTACHQQTDCLKCHSAKSGWSVNPHGPGFDADRMAERSPLMCSRCHYAIPD